MKDFYLTTHRANWVWKDDLDLDAHLFGIPLFVSHTNLREIVNLFPARRRLSIDSGGFSIINTHGSWDAGDSPKQYVAALNSYADNIGGHMIDWAAPQDWMCEPPMMKRTGLTVHRHCELTVQNYLELKSLDCQVRIIPTVQGWTQRDYDYSLKLYDQYGVDLTAEENVGLGSVCRRQGTDEILDIVQSMWDYGLRNIHAYGAKTLGFRKYAHLLHTADSLSWSYQAFKNPAPHDHPHKLGNCANCYIYAAAWWRRISPTRETA